MTKRFASLYCVEWINKMTENIVWIKSASYTSLFFKYSEQMLYKKISILSKLFFYDVRIFSRISLLWSTAHVFLRMLLNWTNFSSSHAQSTSSKPNRLTWKFEHRVEKADHDWTKGFIIYHRKNLLQRVRGQDSNESVYNCYRFDKLPNGVYLQLLYSSESRKRPLKFLIQMESGSSQRYKWLSLIFRDIEVQHILSLQKIEVKGQIGSV
jgi:hypothetical protein